MTKQAMAARLQTAKIINRSQRLTIGSHSVSLILITENKMESLSMMFTWETETRPICPHAGLQGPQNRHVEGAARRVGKKMGTGAGDSRANQASSSSLLLAAGRGAPELSVVGS